jgi:hypothetical protein
VTPPVVEIEIEDFPFMETHCANPADCPVCQATRCQFGRLGNVICPPQKQCERAATQTVHGIRWCDEHAAGVR